MKRFLLLVSCTIAALTVSAQNILNYTISFPNTVHHEAEVTIEVPNVPAGPLTFRMSRSSPGRYATHEFGKNVYGVKASDSKGSLTVIQTAGDVYQVDKHNGTVKITYTIYGNHVDGTYLGIDETHAHMNMPATFMWFPAMTERAMNITFNDLEKYNWKVATQLKPTGTKNTFTAPNLQYFMDSPTELSDFKLAIWKDVNPGNKTQTVRLSSHGTADDQAVIDNYGKMVAKVVAEQKAVFGELPQFDNGEYTFLQDVNPDNNGDGMEHRNSTVITSSGVKIAGNEESMLSTFSHEFFHAWNVERIRPKTLEPFDFSHANMSNELWFAEGFTQYYGNLILKRAGFRTDEQYNGILSGIINGVLNAPGPKSFPATQMSRHAVFVDAGVSVDQSNYANMFTSYYTYGAFVALGLDLRLRSDFNLTLDDYMQAVWKKHGKTEVPYTVPDLQNVLALLTSDSFAQDFFKRYIEGVEKNDYAKLLAQAGLELRKASPGKATMGPLRLTLISYTGKNRVANATLKGSALYEAGIDIGDYILKIGETSLTGAVNIDQITSQYKPGQSVPVTYEHKGAVKTSTLTFQEDSSLTVVKAENPTPQQTQFRNNWLSSKLK
ncbi:M61 family metallopeptidase [Daejeonella lutea]|uniref:Predicted metalloprotease, contains C-terminal PDZ domain n=1 Tax=Daejeonella lutea TaxID=572036 RepID=A0A1T5DRZ5_9SPHI|nr:M61 family metallopeptidase [Daejeonella lutea]SKB74330.1 Predicted metalloprotease, contains C-terminal PDZ domain [Daejeonella lutea]